METLDKLVNAFLIGGAGGFALGEAFGVKIALICAFFSAGVCCYSELRNKL